MVRSDGATSSLIARMVTRFPDLLICDPAGQFVVLPDHGFRDVSTRVLDRTVGHLPDHATLAARGFHWDLNVMLRDLPDARARDLGLEKVMPPKGLPFPGRDTGVFFDFRNADALAGVLMQAGFVFDPGAQILDFGCGTGRTLRTLSLAWPDVAWTGVDTHARAIGWAQAAMPDLTFAATAHYPPLPMADETYDAVISASVWAHFSEAFAITWLSEMGRIIRPGGSLAFSTHGVYDIVKRLARDQIDGATAEALIATLTRSGHVCVEPQDGGTWGTSYMHPDWLDRQLGTTWNRVGFAVGAWGGRQDIHVLQRR